MQNFYQTIELSAHTEYKDRGSRFIAYAFPIKTITHFKEELQKLKKEHPKAVHHCFAYRLGTDGNVFRVSDDGEPKGTAGRPILGQIDSKGITDTAIVVVRYFGGTLLGVPGLIAAYKTAAALVLQLIPLVQKPLLTYLVLHFNYPQLNEVLQLTKQFKGEIIQQELQLFCTIKLGIPLASEQEFVFKFNNIEAAHLEKVLLPS